MHILDDGGALGSGGVGSEQLRIFLAAAASRRPSMSRAGVLELLGEARARGDLRGEDLERSILDFEDGYGGLRYVVRGASQEDLYGLEGDLVISEGPRGPGFEGVFDGQWAWSVLVHRDHSTAMSLDGSPYRMIDDSLEQRLEKHARQWATQAWPHRTWLIGAAHNSSGSDLVDSRLRLVGEASGPADRWWAGTWSGSDCQLELSLSRFGADGEVWALRLFAREAAVLGGDAVPDVLDVGAGVDLSPAEWCDFCDQEMTSAGVCLPEGKASHRLRRFFGRRS